MLDYNILPERMRSAARMYIEDGIDPGSFMQAVLENDFVVAVQKADTYNRAYLDAFAQLVYWEIPSAAWGSKTVVREWISSGGTNGQKEE